MDEPYSISGTSIRPEVAAFLEIPPGAPDLREEDYEPEDSDYDSDDREFTKSDGADTSKPGEAQSAAQDTLKALKEMRRIAESMNRYVDAKADYDPGLFSSMIETLKRSTTGDIVFLCGSRKWKLVKGFGADSDMYVPDGVHLIDDVFIRDPSGVSPEDAPNNTTMCITELARLLSAVIITDDISHAYGYANMMSSLNDGKGFFGIPLEVLELYGNVRDCVCPACNAVWRIPFGIPRDGLSADVKRLLCKPTYGDDDKTQPRLSKLWEDIRLNMVNPNVHIINDDVGVCRNCGYSDRMHDLIVHYGEHHVQRELLEDDSSEIQSLDGRSSLCLALYTNLEDDVMRAVALNSQKRYLISDRNPRLLSEVASYRLENTDVFRNVQSVDWFVRKMCMDIGMFCVQLPDPWQYVGGIVKHAQSDSDINWGAVRKLVSNLLQGSGLVQARNKGAPRKRAKLDGLDEGEDGDYEGGVDEEDDDVGTGREKGEKKTSDDADMIDVSSSDHKRARSELGKNESLLDKPLHIFLRGYTNKRVTIEGQDVEMSDAVANTESTQRRKFSDLSVSDMRDEQEFARNCEIIKSAFDQQGTGVDPSVLGDVKKQQLGKGGDAKSVLVDKLLGISGFSLVPNEMRTYRDTPDPFRAIMGGDTGTQSDKSKVLEALQITKAQLKRCMTDNLRVVVVTGPGLANGGPTEKTSAPYDQRDVQSIRADPAQLETYVRGYPSPAHCAIRSLILNGLVTHVVATAVDGLHAIVGTPASSLVEMYGNVYTSACDDPLCGSTKFCSKPPARVVLDNTFECRMEVARRLTMSCTSSGSKIMHFSVYKEAMATLFSDASIPFSAAKDAEAKVTRLNGEIIKYSQNTSRVINPVLPHREMRALLSVFVIASVAIPRHSVVFARQMNEAVIELIKMNGFAVSVLIDPPPRSVIDASGPNMDLHYTQLKEFETHGVGCLNKLSFMDAYDEIIGELAQANPTEVDVTALRGVSKILSDHINSDASAKAYNLKAVTRELFEVIDKLDRCDTIEAHQSRVDRRIRELHEQAGRISGLILRANSSEEVRKTKSRFGVPAVEQIKSIVDKDRELMKSVVSGFISFCSDESTESKIFDVKNSRLSAYYKDVESKMKSDPGVTSKPDESLGDVSPSYLVAALIYRIMVLETSVEAMVNGIPVFTIYMPVQKDPKGKASPKTKTKTRIVKICAAPIYSWTEGFVCHTFEDFADKRARGRLVAIRDELGERKKRLDQADPTAPLDDKDATTEVLTERVFNGRALKTLRYNKLLEYHTELDAHRWSSMNHALVDLCDECKCTTHNELILPRTPDDAFTEMKLETIMGGYAIAGHSDQVGCVILMGCNVSALPEKLKERLVKLTKPAKPKKKEDLNGFSSPSEGGTEKGKEKKKRSRKPSKVDCAVIACGTGVSDGKNVMQNDITLTVSVRCIPDVFALALAEMEGVTVPEYHKREYDGTTVYLGKQSDSQKP